MCSMIENEKCSVKRKTADDWTPKYVQRLWNWVSSSPHMQDTYFTFQVGEGIVNFLEESGKLKGKVLDYGCGAGFLIERFLEKKLDVWATDFSQKSVALVNSKFAYSPYWKQAKIINGTIIPYSDNCFDVITCTETLEHVPENEIITILQELNRVLKPCGILLITTPFVEDLKRESVYCPFCDSEFHKWQHLRSFSIEDMKELLISNGFQIDFCNGIDFREFQGPMYYIFVPFQYDLLSLWRIGQTLIRMWGDYILCRVLDTFFPMPFPRGRVLQSKLRRVTPRNICAIVSKRTKDDHTA